MHTAYRHTQVSISVGCVWSTLTPLCSTLTLHPAPAQLTDRPFTPPPGLHEVGGSGTTIHLPAWARDSDKLSALSYRNCLSRESRENASAADWHVKRGTKIKRSKSQDGEDLHAMASYFHGNQFSKVLCLVIL